MNSKKKQTQKQCFGPGSGSALIRMYLPGPDLHKGGGALPRLSETDFVQGVFGTLN